MQIKINGIGFEAKEGETILEVAKRNGIEIPTLCYHSDLHPAARCRVCLVEIKGKLEPSCSFKVSPGMEVNTNTPNVIKARKMSVELLLANHNSTTVPYINKHDDLLKIAAELGVKSRFKPNKKIKFDETNPSIIRDSSRCIRCGKCVQKCQDEQSVYAIGFVNRSHEIEVLPKFMKDLGETTCTFCGQCANVCPTGALRERNYIGKVIDAIEDPKKYVVVQAAPSIRAAIGEEFGLPAGSLVTGKMAAALRRVGFNKVFDTDLGADITIMEEGSELLERVKKGGPFPMITTCCPARIKFMEEFYHELFPNMSTCKSPHEMIGALIKTYYAEENNIKKRDIVVVSIMPCTAKKFESTRPELNSEVDYVLTTREAARLIKAQGIDFLNLPDEDFDPALGISTGAGVIFGATGGVMEAALRTAYELGTGKQLEKIEFEQIRGLEAVREGVIEINKKKIKFAAVYGLGNARKLLERKNDYHFIEIMACRGGCIGGGGQPKPVDDNIRRLRMQAIYKQDAILKYRKSHDNPIVQKLYKEYLGKPLSKKAKKLLHTRFTKRGE